MLAYGLSFVPLARRQVNLVIPAAAGRHKKSRACEPHAPGR